MPSDRPIFLRPIYNASTATMFVYNSSNVSIEAGVYASILTLAKEIKDKIAAVDATFDISIGTDFKLTFSATSSFTLNFSQSTMRDILGFTGNLSGSASQTASYTPSHLWFPTYAQADQSEFRYDHGERFSGRTAMDGTTAGVKLDSLNLQRKSFSFGYEPNYNVGVVYARDDYEEQRCLDTFLDGARFSIPTDSNEVASTGAWYYPDYTDAALTSDMSTNAGNDFYRTSSPSTHVFCHVVPGSIANYTPAVPVTREFWNVGFSVTTAAAPSWTAS